MRIAVTGATGFLGTHLTRRLKSLGHEVVGYSSQTLDLRKPFALPPCDAVYHLAGNSRIYLARQDPVLDFELNAAGTLRMLEAVREAGIPKVLYASSVLVYQDLWNAGEEAPTGHSPVAGPYGTSKLVGELYVHQYAALYGIQAVIYRPSGLYGPGMKKNPILDLLTGYASGQTVHLRHHPDSRFDFIYVEDAVDAFLLGLELESGIFNVSSNKGVQLREVYETTAELTGRRVPLRHEGSTVMLKFPHARLRALGWNPRVDLREGLARTWASIEIPASACAAG